MSSEEVLRAWHSPAGLEWAGVTVRELDLGNKLRDEVRDIVHKAVCPDPQSFEEYKGDYEEAFTKDKRSRVLAAFRPNSAAPLGGVAFYNVPDDKPEALYVEFFGVVPESHVGKSLVEQMQQYVKASSEYHLIALNSLDPTHKKQRGEQALKTASFWTMRGFTELRSELFLMRLTGALEPQRLTGNRPKCYTQTEFYKRFSVPEPTKGTVAMVWLPMQS
jgi:hypothetical protein